MQFAPMSTDRPDGLVLLAAERTVTVTREAHHQDALAGRTGRVVVALRPCMITSGKHAGRDGVEVTLDGRRVGELTWLMAQRYRPAVDALVVRGFRVGCEALLREDARGIQVELRLPAEPTATRPPVDEPLAVPTSVVTHAVPRQRMRPPAPHGVPHPPATRRRSRRLLGVVGAVVGVLVVASALGNGSRDDVPTSALSPLPGTVATSTAAARATSTAPAAATVDEPDVAPTTRATARARAASPTTSKQEARATTATAERALRPVPAAPEPAPVAEPEPGSESSGCDPNYSGCVPIASDVDCEGGSGNGPAYVEGPVRIIGKDIYRLDGGGEPGIGCE
jgi:hypothetical protein